MSVFLPRDEVQYLKSQIESSDRVTMKRALQGLVFHMRGSRRIQDFTDVRAIENTVLGRMEVYSNDAKIVSWCLILLSYIGSSAARDSIMRAAQRHPSNNMVVASAVAALSWICRGDQKSIGTMIPAVTPDILALGQLQRLKPKEAEFGDVGINMQNSDSSVLKLALVLVGLGRAPENLFDPKHENADVIRELAKHDHNVVSQYSVWAALENPTLGFNHLGIPLKEIASQPANVRSWLYQLVAQCGLANADLISIIAQGSADEAATVRAGLARGLCERFEDGMEPIVFDWLPAEEDQETRRNLERHVVVFSEETSVYKELAIDWFKALPENSVGRRNMIAAASRTALFGEFKRLELEQPEDLFSAHSREGGFVSNTYNINANNSVFSVAGDANNSGTVQSNVEINNVPDLQAAIDQLLSSIDKSKLTAKQKVEAKKVLEAVKLDQNESTVSKLERFIVKIDSKIRNAVASGEAWATVINAVLAGAKLLSGSPQP